jgi:hypothetical protein
MAELDAIKKKRIAGLMLRRDWGQHAPWPTWPKEDEVDLTHTSRKTKEVIRAAGLRDELTFTSFRHGGFTEAGDSELTDRELMAQGRHKSPKVLGKYVKRTMRQVAAGTRKRLAVRTNGGQLSEAPSCQNDVTAMVQLLENIGAGEGNRTLVISLEGCCSTIELHPHRGPTVKDQQSGLVRRQLTSEPRLVGEVGLEPRKP